MAIGVVSSSRKAALFLSLLSLAASGAQTDRWRTTSDVEMSCLPKAVGGSSESLPLDACRKPLDAETMGVTKKLSAGCMMPGPGTTVTFEKGVANIKEFMLIQVSGCPDVAYYEETFNATKSCGAQNAVTNGETNLGCSLPFKESACYLSTLPPNALYGLSGIQNTPTWRKIIFRIPLTPLVTSTTGSVGLVSLPQILSEGMIGVAVNGVPIIGRNQYRSSTTPWTLEFEFDNCGGQTTVDGKYHYHLPPICLIKRLGGIVPSAPNWWLAPDPATHWPLTIDPAKSPQVGWAIDGFPIYGPYDPFTGELQFAPSSPGGCAATLDQCNGKKMPNGMGYAYFMSPNYPYAPVCTVIGVEQRGTVLDETPASPSPSVCPAKGYNPVQASPTEEDCHILPQAIFHLVPSSKELIAATAVVGGLFSVIALAVLFVISAITAYGGSLSAARVRLAFVLLVFCIFRAVWLLVDPYRMRGYFDIVQSSVIFGIPFPLMVACGLEIIATTYPDLPILARVLGWTLVTGEVAAQIIADISRGYGVHSQWHICDQWIFFGLGTLTFCSALVTAAASRNYVLMIGPFFGLAMSCLTVVSLQVDMGDAASMRYFAWSTTLRVIELLAAMGFLIPVWTGECSRAIATRAPADVVEKVLLGVFDGAPPTDGLLSTRAAVADLKTPPPLDLTKANGQVPVYTPASMSMVFSSSPPPATAITVVAMPLPTSVSVNAPPSTPAPMRFLSPPRPPAMLHTQEPETSFLHPAAYILASALRESSSVQPLRVPQSPYIQPNPYSFPPMNVPFAPMTPQVMSPQFQVVTSMPPSPMVQPCAPAAAPLGRDSYHSPMAQPHPLSAVSFGREGYQDWIIGSNALMSTNAEHVIEAQNRYSMRIPSEEDDGVHGVHL